MVMNLFEMALHNRAELLILCSLVFIVLSLPVQASVLSPGSTGFNGQTRSSNYEELVNAMYANGKVTTTINNNLWVPWFSTSSSCQVSDLQSGNNCNSGETIDFTHNCMVTDEFSQVGIVVAMSQNQTRMDQFYNTVKTIKSSHGQIPAWRVYRSGDVIQACRSGINGNCDTASDATARIIIALYTASNNSYFRNQAQKTAYYQLATTLSRDFLTNEAVYSCKASNQGSNICWWLASGSNAKSGGMGSIDFGYTGYYGDAVIAMLMACTATHDATYCAAAGNFTLNYLQAANFNGVTFSAPPGRSFSWTNLNGVPTAQCTNGCSPVAWDGADAPRALGICMANYYAQLTGISLPRLQTYCDIWGRRYYTSSSSAALRFAPDGTSVNAPQTGYFAQGLESEFQLGGPNQYLFQPTLDSALSHYSGIKRTWDNAACFGVYTTAVAMRALGVGIGRDAGSFGIVTLNAGATNTVSSTIVPTTSTVSPTTVPSTSTSGSTASCSATVQTLPVTCTGGAITSDTYSGCRTIVCTNGADRMQIQACDKGSRFELYKQAQTGTRVSQICLSTACIGTTGFVSSNYPVCAAGSTTTAASTSTTTTSQTSSGTTAVTVAIAPWFPQGRSYVFKCNAAGFSPASYDWKFDDGQTQMGMTQNDVYHTYATAGSHNAVCTAKNGALAVSGTLNVMVA